jgi:glycosyltransferase 2 family protein
MNKRLKTAFQIGLSALALWLVFRQLDGRQLWAVLRRADAGWLCLATGLLVISKLLSASRLRRLFAIAGVRLSATENRNLYWLGMFYNLFLPGGIGGDGYKIWLLNRHGTPVKALLTATLLDRLIGVLPVLSLTLLLGGWLPAVPLPGGWAVAGAALVHLVAWGAVRRFLPDYEPELNRATGLSLGVQLVQCVCVWALVQSLGASGSLIAYQFVFLISSVVATVPLTLGGAGARELTFLLAAPRLGLPVNAAVALSLLFYALTALVSLTGAYFVFTDARLRPVSPS